MVNNHALIGAFIAEELYGGNQIKVRANIRSLAGPLLNQLVRF